MISQDEPSGYQYVEVCYKCTNGNYDINQNIWIKQKINCAIALEGTNGTSLIHNYAFPFTAP